MNAVRRTPLFAAGLALALTFGACGGKDEGCSTNPTAPGCGPPPTTTPPAVRSVIQTSSCDDLGPNVLCFFPPFTTSQRGDLDVTVDWTFAEDMIQVMVSNGSCTLDQINGNQCSFLTTSLAATTPKPRVLTVRGVAAGTYQLYVGNRGPRTESVSIQIGLTTGGAASALTVGQLQHVGAYASHVAAR